MKTLTHFILWNIQRIRKRIPCDFLTTLALFITHSLHCLLKHLLRRKSRKTSKLRVTGLCAGNSPETGEFPAQMASNAEYVFIGWRHQEMNGRSPVIDRSRDSRYIDVRFLRISKLMFKLNSILPMKILMPIVLYNLPYIKSVSKFETVYLTRCFTGFIKSIQFDLLLYHKYLPWIPMLRKCVYCLLDINVNISQQAI